ncbi:MAG: DUF4833 domain-containing protein [Endomicrobium sp.]|nr:DUF4833 domain-containing protein [Endomicrobium sp.]
MKKSKIIMFFIFVLGVFTVTNISTTDGQMISKNLFKIKRNKNANVVMYDVRLDSKGNIDKSNPIDAYWILYDKQGQMRRSEIKAFEKRAYGFTIKYNVEGYYDLVLKAVPDTNIKVILLNGEPKVLIKINNEDAYLLTVFVFAKYNLITTKVLYYAITGVDIKTGFQITKKIAVH